MVSCLIPYYLSGLSRIAVHNIANAVILCQYALLFGGPKIQVTFPKVRGSEYSSP